MPSKERDDGGRPCHAALAPTGAAAARAPITMRSADINPFMARLISLAVSVHELELRAGEASSASRRRLRKLADQGRDALRLGLSVVAGDLE